MGSVTLYLFLIYMLFLEDVTYASNVFGTYINVIIWKLCSFPLIGFENQIVLLFVNPFVILFLLQLCVCGVYLLNHMILVETLIYRGPLLHSADYRVYISESMRASTC